ncbi:hypothetical protein [Roseomonas indoligenes]|uniref:Uncharacterized protein n=1 Tax=Roseomonas indoligenes TaxID=2820811 RepID=A0A940MUW4_9PROT|nr:hypothetical protein [Pararoseomonas indoligenes]MBP0491672.1 hypothetical protein [Pararoseomonas indoligenes]
MIHVPTVPAPDLIAATGNRGGDRRSRAGPAGAGHRRAADSRPQALWIAFGGGADQGWARLLRPGFRHCFAGLWDEAGWTVLDPLSGRLLVTRLAVDPGFDLPGFWRRAGCRVLGPFVPGAPARRLPEVVPLSCVSMCRAVLGPRAPFALTPYGLFQRLDKLSQQKENVLDEGVVAG